MNQDKLTRQCKWTKQCPNIVDGIDLETETFGNIYENSELMEAKDE